MSECLTLRLAGQLPPDLALRNQEQLECWIPGVQCDAAAALEPCVGGGPARPGAFCAQLGDQTERGRDEEAAESAGPSGPGAPFQT